MTTLRDQLLGLGFKASPKPQRRPDRTPERKPEHHAKGRPENPSAARAKPPGAKGPRKPAHTGAQARAKGGEMDLAKAYAIRAQQEKDERIAAEREKQEQARLRREAQQRLDDYLQTVTPLNDASAEIARHFEYGGKIKRIHVTPDQLKALNAGDLGVLQRKGRYLLVSRAQLLQAEAIFADAVALKVDPNTPQPEDPYADPRYQVPDDLVW